MATMFSGFSKACRWQIVSAKRVETRGKFIRNKAWRRMNEKRCTMTGERLAPLKAKRRRRLGRK